MLTYAVCYRIPCINMLSPNIIGHFVHLPEMLLLLHLASTQFYNTLRFSSSPPGLVLTKIENVVVHRIHIEWSKSCFVKWNAIAEQWHTHTHTKRWCESERRKKNVGIGKLTVITSNDNPFFFNTIIHWFNCWTLLNRH